MNRKIILFVPFIALILTLIILYFALIRMDGIGRAGLGLNYCEHSRDALIKQPANTYSNIAFIFAGFIIAWNLMKEKYAFNKNRLTNHFILSCIFFYAMCVNGSMFYGNACIYHYYWWLHRCHVHVFISSFYVCICIDTSL